MLYYKKELYGQGDGDMEKKTEYKGLNGRRFQEKPEDWTHLNGEILVPKDHPRIRFRGQMDLLEAKVVRAQVELVERHAPKGLVDDLETVVELCRQIIRSEVLDERLSEQNIIGLSPQELRRQSHDPQGVFGVEYMKLPNHSLGFVYAALNELRAQARAAETVAVTAFFSRPTQAQRDILQTMNRLSSAFHILMCRVLSGHYAR